MRGTALVVVAALATGLPTFLGCDSTQDTTDPAGETGVVRGWVRHRYTLAGIAGANVICAGRATTSDGTGRFQFDDLPRETTTIEAAAADYQSAVRLIDIRSFQTIMLDLAPLDTLADVTGSVRHPIHGPVNATVALGGRVTAADNNGRWTLDAVALGPHDLVITHPEYVRYTGSVIVHGDGQDLLAILQRDSTLVAPITADAGIHWNPDDGDENNYGDDAELSLWLDPRRSLLVAIPISPGPEGASVHTATLHMYGYLEENVDPLPASVALELRSVYGVWYESSVDAANYPAVVGQAQTRDAAIEEQDPALHLQVDVTAMFARSEAGPATGIELGLGQDAESPLSIYTREALPSSLRPWLSITVRY